MRDDALYVRAGMRTVVVGLEQDDMCSGLTGKIGSYLRLVGLFFQHGDGHEESAQRFDSHRIGDEDIRSAFLTTFVEVALDGASVIGALDEFDIVVIIPDHGGW